MKEIIAKGFTIGLFIFVLIVWLIPAAVRAEDLDFYSMKATAYCLKGQTASGEWVREGICASKPEWIGSVVAIYINDNGMIGDFLGYYEIKDTGGEPIRKGHVIDIWMEKYEDCIQFGNPNVFVLIVEDS